MKTLHLTIKYTPTGIVYDWNDPKWVYEFDYDECIANEGAAKTFIIADLINGNCLTNFAYRRKVFSRKIGDRLVKTYRRIGL